MGRKVDDRFVVPLCYRCHMDCHTRGDEGDWWIGKTRKDPISWALKYHENWSEKTQEKHNGEPDVDV